MEKKSIVYNMHGYWNELIQISDIKGSIVFSWNRRKLYPERIMVDDSNEYSSTRVWHTVCDALQRGDFTTSDKEKHRIEEEQRQRGDSAYQPQFFNSGTWKFKGPIGK